MSCGSAVYNISTSPKLLGGLKYDCNREKETSPVLKEDQHLVKDSY